VVKRPNGTRISRRRAERSEAKPVGWMRVLACHYLSITRGFDNFSSVFVLITLFTIVLITLFTIVLFITKCCLQAVDEFLPFTL